MSLVLDVGPHAIGGGVHPSVQLYQRGAFVSLGADGYGLLVEPNISVSGDNGHLGGVQFAPTLQKRATGKHPIAYTLRLAAPNLVGSRPVGVAGTLIIDGPPVTDADQPPGALLVLSGKSILSGPLVLGGGVDPASGTTLPIRASVLIGAGNVVVQALEQGTALLVGTGNHAETDAGRFSELTDGFAAGRDNAIAGWSNVAGGTANIVKGKVATAFGASNLILANDSVVLGNRCSAGSRFWAVQSQGVDDPGLGIGDRAFVIVAAGEGDITGFFPNAQRDSDAAYLLATYGAGATCVDGNVYPAGGCPITFALHPYLLVRDGLHEGAVAQFLILAATFSGAGTKIYYDSPTSAYPTISHVYGSYAPQVLINGTMGGNGQIAAGLDNQTYGYGAVSGGARNRSVANYTTTFGANNTAAGPASTVLGEGGTVAPSAHHSVLIALSDQSGTDPVEQPNLCAILGGNVAIGDTVAQSVLRIQGLVPYVDNAAALNGGLEPGDVYRVPATSLDGPSVVAVVY